VNTQSDNSKGGPQQGVRPTILIGILAVAGLVVVVAVLVLRSKSPASGPEGAPGATASTAPAQATTHPVPGTGAQPAVAATSGPAATGRATVAASGAGTQAGTAAPVNVNELISTLKNASLPMKDRKAAIEALAKLGTPEAIAALKEALTGGADDLRAAIAEGLGQCGSPECATMLQGLLNDPNPAVAQAAIRGLAQLGTPEAVTSLAQILNDSLRSSDLRAEAATGLGTVNQPGAMTALAQAAMTLGDEDLVTQVLDAIGGRNFSETKDFFQQYMGSAASSDLRVAAIESLWQAQGDPSGFLAGYLSDSDPEVRASAAWALSATDATGNLGAQLLGALQSEQDPNVRLRLYQALRNQDSFDPGTALALVQQETDPTARVAGMDLLASSLRSNPNPAVQTFFDQTAAPALEQAALTGASTSDRMAALIALVRASTPSAMSALQDIAQQSTDPRVKASAAKIVANPMPAMPAPAPGH